MARKEGFYRVELIKTVWEVPERYQNLLPVGHGAFGQVCSATDTERRSPDGSEVDYCDQISDQAITSHDIMI